MSFRKVSLALSLLFVAVGASAQNLPGGPQNLGAASAIEYDPSSSACVGTNVQDALTEACAGGAGGGTNITLDLGDDDSDESTSISEIAIVNDTGSVMTEPTADKLLFDWDAVTFDTEINSEANLESFLGGINLIVATETADLEADDLSDDAATDLSFTPTDSRVWASPAPANVGAALDGVADRGTGDRLDACRDGDIRGGGYDASTNRYEWVCLLYPWETEAGGRQTLGGGEIVGDYSSALSATEVVERIVCTGDGTGTHPTIGAVTEEGCQHDGHVVYDPIQPRFMLALDHLVPGGTAYLAVPNGDGDGAAFMYSGCGATSTTTYKDTPVPCPILRPPNDHFQHRAIQLVEDRKIVYEGTDPDGPRNPKDRPSNERLVGVTILIETGHGQGCLSGLCEFDRNGDLVAVEALTAIQFGGDVNDNDCNPVLDGSTVRCDVTPNNQNLFSISEVVTGREFSLQEDSNTTFPDVCIDDRESVSGTCRGDSRIKCTAENTECDFSGSGGPDLDPCDSAAEHIEQIVRGNNDLSARIRLSTSQLSFDHAADLNGGVTTILRPTAMNEAWGSCNAGNGRSIPMGAWNSLGTAGFPGKFQQIVIGTPLPDTLQLETVKPSITLSAGSEVRGGTWTHATPQGRIADDDQESGTQTATGGSATTLVNTAANWTVDEWQFLTAVVRPNAGFPDEGYFYHGTCDCDTTLCTVAAAIASNTSDTLTLQAEFGASAWTSDKNGASCALAQDPQSGDEYRISAASCPANDRNLNAEACDGGRAYRQMGFARARMTDFSAWSSGAFDSSERSGVLEISDASIKEQKDILTDAGPFIFRNVEIDGISTGGAPAINASFQGPTRIRDVLIKNYRGTMISVGTGKHLDAEGIRFENGSGIGFNITSGPISIRNVVSHGHSGVFITVAVAPLDAIWASSISDVVARNFTPTQSGGRHGLGLIEFTDVLGSSTGEIRSLLIDNVHAYMDRPTNTTKVPATVNFDLGAANVDQYQNVTVRNSSCETLNSDGCKVTCAVDFTGSNIGCEHGSGIDVHELANPPIVLNNRANGLPEPDQPYHWRPAADYKGPDGQAQFDCDDVGTGFGALAIDDDTAPGACDDDTPADGLLDGGGTARSLCFCSEGTWHSAY